jgi:hypothetical protein
MLHLPQQYHQSRCLYFCLGLQSPPEPKNHNDKRRQIQNQSWRRLRVSVHPKLMIRTPCWMMHSGMSRISPGQSKGATSEANSATCSFKDIRGCQMAYIYCTSSKCPIYRSAERIILGSFDFGRSEL